MKYIILIFLASVLVGGVIAIEWSDTTAEKLPEESPKAYNHTEVLKEKARALEYGRERAAQIKRDNEQALKESEEFCGKDNVRVEIPEHVFITDAGKLIIECKYYSKVPKEKYQ